MLLRIPGIGLGEVLSQNIVEDEWETVVRSIKTMLRLQDLQNYYTCLITISRTLETIHLAFLISKPVNFLSITLVDSYSSSFLVRVLNYPESKPQKSSEYLTWPWRSPENLGGPHNRPKNFNRTLKTQPKPRKSPRNPVQAPAIILPYLSCSSELFGSASLEKLGHTSCQSVLTLLPKAQQQMLPYLNQGYHKDLLGTSVFL